MKKVVASKKKKISLHISRLKIKAFIICVGLSFITNLSLNIIYGDYDVEKYIKKDVVKLERKLLIDRAEADKENPAQSLVDRIDAIRPIRVPAADKVYPTSYSYNDYYVKRITFNPFYGKEYYKKYAGEKFSYANYIFGDNYRAFTTNGKLKKNQWTSVAKGEFILMCSFYNLHFTLFFGFMLFIIFLGIKFLITNFQIKLKD